MKNTYIVINMITEDKFGTFTNKAEAFKKRSFVRKMSKNPLPATGFSRSDYYHTHVVKNYVEIDGEEDIYLANMKNIVTR